MAEEKLIRQAINNNRNAQREIYMLYRSYWFVICLRYVKIPENAEDVLQEALVKIFLNLSQFDNSKGNFKSWSSKIVVNENLIFLRKNKQNIFVELNDEILNIEQEEISENVTSTKALVTMIQKLPVGYRTVFNLYVVEGYSHKEISEILQISLGSSKSQLFKAKKMLKLNLEAQLLESYE